VFNFGHKFKFSSIFVSDSARHRFQDICPPIFQIVLKNFINISLIIQECSEEILIKLANFICFIKAAIRLNYTDLMPSEQYLSYIMA
jgi:hypothetical protein